MLRLIVLVFEAFDCLVVWWCEEGPLERAKFWVVVEEEEAELEEELAVLELEEL